MKDTLEQWLPVVGDEGFYSVSTWGRVRCEARMVKDTLGRLQPIKERILNPCDNGKGYLVVSVHGPKGQRTRMVHLLVAEAFIGPRPAWAQTRHGTGGKLDNRLCNLSYGTQEDNCADKLRDGTDCRGEKGYQSKLTEAKVREARRLIPISPRGTLARLAREWGVASQVLGRAVRGQTWAWLED